MSDKFNEMMNKISNNSAEENKKLAEDMQSKLSDDQKQAVERLLSDSNIMQKLLENEKVREIMSKFGGGTDGHR